MVWPSSHFRTMGQGARRESAPDALTVSPVWLAWLSELQATLAEEEDDARFAR